MAKFTNNKLPKLLLAISFVLTSEGFANPPSTYFTVLANVPDVSSLTQAQAIALFSASDRRWPQNGASVIVIIRDDGQIHAEFTQKILNISPRTLKRSWDRRVYMGTGWKPIIVNSWEEMLTTIKRIPGAIGYMPSDLIDEENEKINIDGLSIVGVVTE